MKRLALILLLALGGCVVAPTSQELASADYGPLPPASYQDQIKDYMVGVLKDPMSAQYIFEEAKKGWMRDAPIAGGKIHYAREVKTKINGKNGFGGYVGFQSYSFWFKNEKIISATNANGLGFDRNGNLSVTSE